MKISIIGGGNMGGAIAKGVIERGVTKPSQITISHLSKKMEHLFAPYIDSLHIENRNAEAIKGADYIILAVKPWLLEEVIAEISDTIDFENQRIISVVAGVTFDQMCTMLGTRKCTIYRVIPNTAIIIGQGVTTISSYNSNDLCNSEIATIFGALGATYFVDESMMTPLTSLSSCGIAFALRYIDAAAKGGVEVGIDAATSLEVTLETLKGAIAILENNNSQPQAEIDKVTTKGGITLKGLEAMEREGFSKAVKDAIKESR